MGRQRTIVALLALLAILAASAAPALAQAQGSMMAVEQSDKDMMGALAATKDTSIPAMFFKAAGIEGMMKPGEKYTLFVASDNVLKPMGSDMKNKVMENLKDRQKSTEFIRGHMINGMITPDQMTDGKTLTMMNGMTVKVHNTNSKMMVDDVNIVKAVRTSNGMIYVMGGIPSSIGSMMEQMGMLPMKTTK